MRSILRYLEWWYRHLAQIFWRIATFLDHIYVRRFMSDSMPDDLIFYQEWRRIVFAPNGERVGRLESNWYNVESLARGLLNSEYPEKTSTGWYMLLETRWVSEHRPAETVEPSEINWETHKPR